MKTPRKPFIVRTAGFLAIAGLVAASFVQIASPVAAAPPSTCNYTCFDGVVCYGKDKRGRDCFASPGQDRNCSRILPPCRVDEN